MQLTLNRMREILPTINKRPQSLKRLIRAARENYYELYFVPLAFDGYFVPAHLSNTDNPQVFVSSRLDETTQIAALTHELTHLGCQRAPNEFCSRVVVNGTSTPNKHC